MLSQFNGIQVSFQGSILGFDELDTFVMEAVEETPFAYLNSIENPELSFLVTPPFQWYKNYELQLSDLLKKRLNTERPEEILVLSIVTIRDPQQASTINLMAPLIINVSRRVGLQHVFHEQTAYKTNSPLFADDQGEGGEK
ncbi:flagellar assembly protein FliW [Paenibacillus sp. FSL H8-0457]|uniref:flagellar assembly protein FliW n=1 Tax=unclassified Paenibacillus TaxID=185978 RepID=UPI0001789132|nr:MULTISPECIES: flagellar assembly protein FliW [unclassified Paenibacillus]ACX68075.1 protein of unknown function DUF180 [Paenibacillus sp. Y412MC10]ETT67826.1 hypothetical protein C172_05687 [Paenibacillus sp. FSL H8-457]